MADTWAARNLEPTDDPEVFLNPLGIEVDKAGVAHAYKGTGYRDTARLERALGGRITSPAELLKAVSLDDTLPLGTRLDAARAAAPYYDRKQPQRVETEEIPTTLFSAEQLKQLDEDELAALERLMAKLSATSQVPPAPARSPKRKARNAAN